MAKYQVRLLVLIALGTISSCRDAGGPPRDSVAVITSPSGAPPLGCGPKTVNVRFNAIKVKGPDSDVVYHRVTVRDVHLQFATNTSVSLPSDSFLECAKAAASAGLDAFVFNGSCTGYSLNLHFLKCQAGDLAVYVLPEYLDVEPVVVTMDAAPYKLADYGDDMPNREYMISAFVEADDDHRNIEKSDGVTRGEFNFIFRENGDIIKSSLWLLDVKACFNNGAYGLKIALNSALDNITWPVVYFFEECGNTVKVPKPSHFYKMTVISHPGFGCQYYPSGLPDECTVNFEGEDSIPFRGDYGFFFPETGPDDGGLEMTIHGINDETGEKETENMYQFNYYAEALPNSQCRMRNTFAHRSPPLIYIVQNEIPSSRERHTLPH